MEEKEIIVSIIDLLKQLIDSFSNVRNPILVKEKFKFNLFYENELKFREVIEVNNDDLTVFDFYKICENNRIDAEQHSQARVNYVRDYSFICMLFYLEKMQPNKASAWVFKRHHGLSQTLLAIQDEIQINLAKDKPYIELTKAEKETLNFNWSRPKIKIKVERQIKMLEPFIDYYKVYTPDQKFLEILENKEIKNKNEKLTLSELAYKYYYLETSKDEMITDINEKRDIAFEIICEKNGNPKGSANTVQNYFNKVNDIKRTKNIDREEFLRKHPKVLNSLKENPRAYKLCSDDAKIS